MSDFERDGATNSISNRNAEKYKEYISKRNSKIKEDKKLDRFKIDLDNIREEINDIKEMLKKLTDGL
tara:strand:+ start:584 stop:784 length:201 start_codon:yes stop_codon:yes gene_type:complete